MSEEPRPGATDSLVDVAGLRVGHATLRDERHLTGSTVVLAPEGGMSAGVDVRGGGPGTRETDALDPRNVVERIHAVCLTGGSAFGLAAADGVMAALFEAGVGLSMGGPGEVVPIVPAAVVFDLGRGGDFVARPDAATGRRAHDAALAATPGERPAQGCVGAGTGATAGGLKGGVGTASAVLPDGTTVAALVVLNALGEVVDPATGELLARRLLLPDERARVGVPSPADARSARDRARRAPERPVGRPGAATTIGVVATDSTLTKAACSKLAGIAHDGLARAVDPVHTMFDGDTFFGLATNARPEPAAAGFHAILDAAGRVTARAVAHAVLAAETTSTPGGTWRSYREAYPSAVEENP